MKYISAQPEIKYYEWQVDTMINSYLKNDVSPFDIIVLLGNTGEYKFDKLRSKYKYVSFISYPYKPEVYAPAVKPYLMSKYFGSCKCTQGEQYYYADADTILLKPLGPFTKDRVWLSDTKSYIGYDYIASKGEEILNIMADTAKIDKRIIENKKDSSGGAQYVFTGTDSDFWKSVYVTSNALYREMRRYNNEHKEKYKDTYPIQAWTAEMWATLWQFWKRGIKTEITKRLDFAWSTDKLETMEGKAILHNAGVLDNHTGFFRKSDWQNEYPSCNLDITKTHCNYYYYKKVLEATC